MRITAVGQETTTSEPGQDQKQDQEQAQDSGQLLYKINCEYLRITSSRITKVNHCLGQWFGMMPKFMISKKLATNYCNGVFSNVPTYETQVSILGHPILSTLCSANAPTTAGNAYRVHMM